MKNSQKEKEPTGEQMTLLLSEASHASHTAKPESDLGRMTSDTSGRRCCESFQKLSQPTLWAKMFMALLIGQMDWSSKKCALTWKLKATKYNRYYCQLQASVRHINECDVGLLPTPTAVQREHPDRVEALKESGAETIYSRANGEMRPNSIIDHLQFHGLLPTPTAMDSTNATANMKSTQIKEGSMHSMTLSRAMTMGMLPTPVAGEYRDTGEKVRGNNYKQKNLTRTIANNSEEWAGSNSQLSPQFVAEMMGFPTDWTVLPFLSGETNQ